jgi:hypothetical protein
MTCHMYQPKKPNQVAGYRLTIMLECTLYTDSAHDANVRVNQALDRIREEIGLQMQHNRTVNAIVRKPCEHDGWYDWFWKRVSWKHVRRPEDIAAIPSR